MEFLERIKDERLLEIPLQKITTIIPQKILPYDAMEKICGNILFDFLDFKEGEDLVPNKRFDLFMEKVAGMSIKNDFHRLCREKRFYEISLLLDNDKTDEIKVIEWFYEYNFLISQHLDSYEPDEDDDCIIVPLTELALLYDIEIIKILHQKNRKFVENPMDRAAARVRLDIMKFFLETSTMNPPKYAMPWVCQFDTINDDIVNIASWLCENYPEISRPSYAKKCQCIGDHCFMYWIAENGDYEAGIPNSLANFIFEKYPDLEIRTQCMNS